MEITINNNKLQLVVGDITTLNIDAIVNAANGTLLGGGGVDGAIHKKAGPQLLEACKHIRKNDLNGDLLNTGEAVITKGYDLPASFVIHTVGPIWANGNQKEASLLKNCYTNCLKLAQQSNLKQIAFPSISTGVYRYPIHLASKVALQTISEFLQTATDKTIIITLFSSDDYDIYKHTLQKLSLK